MEWKWYSKLNLRVKTWEGHHKAFFEEHRALHFTLQAVRWCFEQAPQILAAIVLFSAVGWGVLSFISAEEWSRAFFFIVTLAIIFTVLRIILSSKIKSARNSPAVKQAMTILIVAIIGAAIGAPLAVVFYFLGPTISVNPLGQISTPTQTSKQPSKHEDDAGPRFSVSANPNILLSLGGYNAGFDKSKLEAGPEVLLRFKSATALLGKLKDRRLCIDALVYTGENQKPIQLKDNNVENLPSGWDSNFSDKALEIVNEDGLPMFQLVYKDENTAMIRGVFCVDNMVGILDDFSLGFFDKSPAILQKYNVKRIFKYPDWKFHGQYEDNAGQVASDKDKERMAQYRATAAFFEEIARNAPLKKGPNLGEMSSAPSSSTRACFQNARGSVFALKDIRARLAYGCSLSG